MLVNKQKLKRRSENQIEILEGDSKMTKGKIEKKNEDIREPIPEFQYLLTRVSKRKQKAMEEEINDLKKKKTTSSKSPRNERHEFPGLLEGP